MIVKNPKEMQRYLLSINLKPKEEEDTRFNSFLSRAQQWLTEHIIGEEIETALETVIEEGQTDPHKKLRELASCVISERAYLDSVAESDLQRSEVGFVVQNNEKMSPASQQRVDRLVQSLNERLNTDCDALVDYLLKNSKEGKAYENWRGTVQFAFLTDAFIPTMAVLRQNTSQRVVNRWQEFYDLQPRLVIALRTTVANYISTDEVDALLELYRYDELLETQRKALRYVRMSVLAEITDTGSADHFALEARQWMLKHESDFPEFVDSDCYELPKPFDFGDGTVANLL